MEIGNAVSPFTAGVAVSAATTTTRKQQAASPASAETGSRVYQRAMGTTGAGEADLLANNFTRADGGQSKYIAATLTKLQTDRQFGDKMGSLLSSLDAQYAQLAASGTSAYTAAARMRHTVEEGVQQVTNDAYLTASADNLDDLKNDREQRAEAATQPQDANQTDTPGTAATTHTDDMTAREQAAPTEQASATSTAPGTDAAPAETTPPAATTDEAVATGAGQAATAPAPTAASVDRMV